MSTNNNKIYSGPVPFQVEAVISAAAATSFMIAIDLDNANGSYKHSRRARGIRLFSCRSVQSQTDLTSDIWASGVGVIVAINGTRAVVAAPCACDLITAAPSRPAADSYTAMTFGYEMRVVDGALANYVGPTVEITDINTGVTLDDAAGNSITPAVGDVILSLASDSPDGTATTARCLQYTAF